MMVLITMLQDLEATQVNGNNNFLSDILFCGKLSTCVLGINAKYKTSHIHIIYDVKMHHFTEQVRQLYI